MANSGALYARARHLRAFLITAAICAAAIALWGGRSVVFPAGTSSGQVVTSMASLLTIPPAVALAGSLHSDMASFDVSATRDLRPWQIGQVAIGWLIASPFVAGTFAGIHDLPAAFAAGRDLTLWLGMSLLTGRMLTSRLGWTGPLTILPFMIYFGPTDTGFRWWAWTLQGAESPQATFAAIILLACGLVGIWIPRRRPLGGFLRA